MVHRLTQIARGAPPRCSGWGVESGVDATVEGKAEKEKRKMNFITIQDGDYILNLAQVASIDCTDPDSWVVTMSSGKMFTIEGRDRDSLNLKLLAE